MITHIDWITLFRALFLFGRSQFDISLVSKTSRHGSTFIMDYIITHDSNMTWLLSSIYT